MCHRLPFTSTPFCTGLDPISWTPDSPGYWGGGGTWDRARPVVQREHRAFTAEFKGGGGAAGGGTAGGRSVADTDWPGDGGQLRASTRLHRQAIGEGSVPAGETLEQQNRRLRREVATLRQELSSQKVAV